ncbi:RNA polymerase factor sigma-54 [Bacillus sp. DNRA2]|uniref:RNA polymerase factor sigma-54 n=1 Tax=Bacillus sp. DNRA2 TaxID=2723053 RepID=UPI00145D94FD|nr:RNA polymerase factor sigma-54 [Bacillus sp. DNRA2]NMD68917.1 RNA polymerase factor sigma-54 [Bacillus sp. DNRA2]
MDLRPGLSQQQTLKLSMTQELSQAIALLQYSSIELVDFLENKTLENPLLQIKNSSEILQRKKKRNDVSKANEKSWIDQISDQRFSLADHIMPQILDMRTSMLHRKILSHYIHHLDDNGYFTGDLQEITDRLQISGSIAEECLHMLQKLEPAGIGARNLQECLLIQIQRQKKRNQLAEEIIAQHFSMFAEKKWKALAKLIGKDVKEIQQVFDFILTLNPKPGAAYHYEKAPYVIPDVMVVQEGDLFIVQLFDNLLPRIQLNKEYIANFSNLHDKSVNNFLREKQQDYQWIVRSLEQRQRTIVNVTEKIVEKQHDYFSKGPKFLKPMTMKEISEELGIHESTVSRTVREKYVQTPFGTVELKSFFTSAIDSVSSEALSSSKVKLAIQKLVKEENKQKPLSDLDMVEVLKAKEGIVVSRRTVAKYREQLGIPSSSKRKRYD